MTPNSKNVGIFRRLGVMRWMWFKKFKRNEDGATAVEFAFVALPFFAFMFAIIETGLIFFASQTLETAVSDSARLIMTGQAQNAKFQAGDFKNAVCDKISAFMDCAVVSIDVRKFSSFGGVSFDPLIDKDGKLTNNFVYQPGNGEEIIVVRLMYPFPVYANLWNSTLTNLAGNKRLLVATATFRNEPF